MANGLISMAGRECERKDWKRKRNTYECTKKRQLLFISPRVHEIYTCKLWVEDPKDFITSFLVTECLSHAYYTVDLEVIWPFHSIKTPAISRSFFYFSFYLKFFQLIRSIE